MGYWPRHMKVRRHNYHLRLYAATILAGAKYDRWEMYRSQFPNNKAAYEVVLPPQFEQRLWPYGPLATAVRAAAEIMEID